MSLYTVTIQDKSLYGEPDVALAVVEAPLADDACRAALPTIKALADRGRGRCVPHASHLELGRFYRLGALVRVARHAEDQGLPLDLLPDAAVDRLLTQRDRAEAQRDQLATLLRGAILVIDNSGLDASGFRRCLDDALRMKESP